MCSGCKEKGHVRKDCPYYDTRCLNCGQTGHANRHCSYVHGNLPYVSGHTDSAFSDDASVNMVLTQETDLPEDPRPLTPQECAEYVESLGAAPFWSDLSDEKKASCFQAEVVEGIPQGRIPRAPRARKLITQEMMVDGILVKTVFDSGASVCLIPRKMFLHLVSKLGKEFYDGKLAPSPICGFEASPIMFFRQHRKSYFDSIQALRRRMSLA